MDIIILAAGLGSRLSKYTHNTIPKYLINIDNYNGLYHLITYWNQYANNIYLVINSKYNNITNFYIKNLLTNYQEKIKIINYDNSDGTAYTINYILNNDLKDNIINNLLITWCDLYPIHNINFNKIKKSKNDNNIYIFTNGNKCRYKLNDNNEIINCNSTSDGNIIGIYYFQNYKKFTLDDNCINNDIVSYLNNIGQIFNYKLDSIIDYGDEDKILDIFKNSNKSYNFNCRYFNNIEIIENNKLFKKGINDKGKEIIKYEKNWYEYINNLNNNEITDILPKIYNIYEYGFIMEYKINYIPVYKYLIDNENNTDIKIKVLNNIIKKLDKIHQIEKIEVSKLVFFNNLKKEIYDKIIERRNIILDLINHFNIIETVNNVKIDTFENILNKCKNIILTYYETIEEYQYSIILGDCQFSNILIDPSNNDNIVFIDPRGYYGNSMIHGPSDYDYAKILYGISGFDNFNFDHFNLKNIDLENKSIQFNIDGIYYDKKFINHYFNKVHKAYLVVIWLSLAEYNKNNIWKCLASYYYGLYLGTLL